MSRPADPSYSVPIWATDTNYVAGPNAWNGQLTKVVPPSASQGFTPASAYGTGYMNYLINGISNAASGAKTTEQAILDYLGQSPVLNFSASALSGTWRHAIWNPYYRAWFVVGGAADARWSYDSGQTWTTSTAMTTGLTTETPVYADSDAAGNMVVASTSRYAGAYIAYNSTLPANSQFWTKPDVHANANTYSWARVFYSPVTNKWTVMGIGVTPSLRTSTDRATWSAGTIPANWTTAAGTYGWAAALPALDINKTSGRLVGACNFGAVGGAFVATSDDNGATWTNRQTFNPSTPLGGVAPTSATMFYDSYANQWLYAVAYVTSGAGAVSKTVLYKSLDEGLTFTQVAVIASAGMFAFARLGSLLVATATVFNQANNGKTEVLFSKDNGGSWFATGVGPSTVYNIPIGQAPGQILLADTNVVRPSFRTGMPTTQVT